MVKVALLIGVSEYAAGLNPLPKAVDDIEAMKTVLEKPELGGFSEVMVLPNPDPFKMQFEIEQLFAERSKDDLILLFFSGHGVKDDSGNLYFATAITRKTPEGELIKSTAVPSRFVHDIMSNSRSRRQVVILDCCFSGAFAKGLSAKDDGNVNIKEELGGEGRVVLTSSAATQYSFEQAEASLSVYTRYLVEGISSGAADSNNDGTVSIGELHEYAKRKVHESAPAMKPKIYAVEEGFKILLTQSPVLDPVVVYRKEVEQCASRGQISSIGRRILDELRERLLLSQSHAAEIEAAVFKPYREYEAKLQDYRQVLKETLAQESPLGEAAKAELKRYQQVLGLRDKDVAPIKTQILVKPLPSSDKHGSSVQHEPSQHSSQGGEPRQSNAEKLTHDVENREPNTAPSDQVFNRSADAPVVSPSSAQVPTSSVAQTSSHTEVSESGSVAPHKQTLSQRGLAPSGVAGSRVSALNEAALLESQQTLIAAPASSSESPSVRKAVSTPRRSFKLVWIFLGAVSVGLSVGFGLYSLFSSRDVGEIVSSCPDGTIVNGICRVEIITGGGEDGSVEITSPYKRPQAEVALSNAFIARRDDLGVNDKFLSLVTNYTFHLRHPELNGKDLEGEDPVLLEKEEPLRVEWIEIANEWLTFLQKHLSKDAIANLEYYSDDDNRARVEKTIEIGLPAIAIHDIADARFYSMFENSSLIEFPKQFLGSDGGTQLWRGIAEHTLEQVRSGESNIVERLPLRGRSFKEPRFIEEDLMVRPSGDPDLVPRIGTVREEGTLAVGEGKVYLMDVPEGGELLTIRVNAPPGTTKLSVLQPDFLADVDSVPSANEAIEYVNYSEHDDSKTTVEAEIDQGGIYSIVLISTSPDTFDYEISIDVGGVPEES